MNFEITSGKVSGKGRKVVIYGPEGVGKSSLAARFPNPVFIDTEGSTDSMDVRRLPKPTSWDMLRQEVQFVMNGGASCGTLVIDTFDWAENLCITMLCTLHSKKGIEDFGYGNGYVYEREEIARFMTLLEEVTLKGIHVVISCHACTRKYELPEEMGQFDRWELKLGKKTGSQISPLVKEWADLVLFFNYKTHVYATDDKGKRHKAAGKERVMYTSHHPCWDAKNRCGLPDELPLAWESIAHIFEPAASAPPAQPVQQMLEKAQAMGIPTTPQNLMEGSTQIYPPENSEAAPAYSRPEGIPKELADLMEAHYVTPEELQAVVEAKGHMPKGMPIRDYPLDYVQGCLVAAWPQVLECITANRLK